MDSHSTEAMEIHRVHRSDAESPTFRRPGLLWVVLALLGFAIIIFLLPPWLFMNTTLDLAFPHP
jgi:hypothetical protein